MPKSAHYLHLHNIRQTFAYNDMYFMAGEVKSVSWDFGDGTTSGENNPVHAFASALPVTPSVTAERKSMKPSNTRHSSAGMSFAFTSDTDFGGMQPLKYRLLTS